MPVFGQKICLSKKFACFVFDAKCEKRWRNSLQRNHLARNETGKIKQEVCSGLFTGLVLQLVQRFQMSEVCMEAYSYFFCLCFDSLAKTKGVPVQPSDKKRKKVVNCAGCSH